MFRPVWIEVDLGALRRNFSRIRKLLPRHVKVIATVKQSAYGHGLVPVVRELAHSGVDFFGVGSLEEAIALRKAGCKKNILVLSVALDKFADYFLKYNIRPTVASLDFAKALHKACLKAKRRVPIHVKIDTGMGRLGFYYEDAFQFIKELRKLPYLAFEGIFTHLPIAEDKKFTNYQLDIFDDFVKSLEKEGIHFTYKHCANSLGLLNYRNAHFNMVRPGLILYGVKPEARLKFDVEPVLSLKSRIIFIKRIKKGMSVSYGRTFVAKRDTNIATVSIGYADGYPWALSNRARVIIKNNFFNVVGRVCMDHVMVDVRKREDICVGDEVILIGSKGTLKISVETLSKWAKTIPYEIASRLSLKIPRIYKNYSKTDSHR